MNDGETETRRNLLEEITHSITQETHDKDEEEENV